MPTKNFKVLFLASWYPWRAQPLSGIFVKKHALAVARFCEVSVLYVDCDPGLKGWRSIPEVEIEDGLFTVRVLFPPCHFKIFTGRSPSAFINRVRYALACYRGFRIIKKNFGIPHIVQVNVVLPAGLIALVLKWFLAVPYIVVEHWSGFTNEDGRYRSCSLPVRFLIRLVFRYASAAVAISRYLLNALKTNGLLFGPGVVIPNVALIPDDPDRNRERLKAPVKAITVSHLIDAYKNLSGLIRAFANLMYQNVGAELHILGDGEDRSALEALAFDLGILNQSVFFHGYIPNHQLNRFLSTAHFFVLNSNFETFSAATVEALAHGLPVVVTRCGGPEEFVTQEVGVLVERQNEESLLWGIHFMIENWSTYSPSELSKYAKERFSEELVGKEFWKLYRSYAAIFLDQKTD